MLMLHAGIRLARLRRLPTTERPSRIDIRVPTNSALALRVIAAATAHPTGTRARDRVSAPKAERATPTPRARRTAAAVATAARGRPGAGGPVTNGTLARPRDGQKRKISGRRRNRRQRRRRRQA